MSQMQEALYRKNNDCAECAVPVLEPCETDTQELSDKRRHESALGESGRRQLKPTSIPRIVRNHATRPDRHAMERTSRFKSLRVTRTSAPGTGKRSENRRIPTHCHESVAGEPLQKQSESIEAQILRFQQRADLRECLLPGMLSRISPKACEGWQQQASVRNSRMMAKVKLEFCRNCRFGLKREPASV